MTESTPSARVSLASASRGALLSDCQKFRYALVRRWGQGKPLLFVMLNPSTADAVEDDATIRRCAGFATSHAFGAFEVVNLFAYRATDPQELRAAGWQVGPDNDRHIADAVQRAGAICVAWGANAKGLSRPAEVMRLLRLHATVPIQCLGLTASGHPQHPLMLPADRRLMPFPGLRG